MRIRSIKPEFWRSRHVALLPWDLRLLFIGLWSYVDDNGVGLDDAWQIQSDVFPVEGDPVEARERVSRGLDALSRVVHESSSAPLIVRYEANGRRYLAITGWQHQRIDRPSKARYPAPSEEDLTRANAESAIDSRESVASPPANNTSVTGEQGNRGSSVPSERGGAAPPTDTLLDVAHADSGSEPDEPPPVTAQTIVGEWIERCSKRPPGKVIGQISKQIKEMLDEGIDPDDVRRGLADWMTRKAHPSVLPSVVDRVMNHVQPTAKPSPNATDQRVAALMQPMLEQTAGAFPALRALPGGA
jgi:hypothetical protein